MTLGDPDHGLRFVPLRAEDVEDLAGWLASEEWPYHLGRVVTAEAVRARFARGGYSGDEHRTFWILDASNERVGLLRIDDLLDPCPMFDLRVRSAHRGCGIGTAALRWLAAHVFGTMPSVWRLEGQTREDNRPMRRVFLRCGWAKEAHYRQAWPTADGRRLASIGYGLLRSDWETGSTTPVDWDDEEGA